MVRSSSLGLSSLSACVLFFLGAVLGRKLVVGSYDETGGEERGHEYDDYDDDDDCYSHCLSQNRTLLFQLICHETSYPGHSSSAAASALLFSGNTFYGDETHSRNK